MKKNMPIIPKSHLHHKPLANQHTNNEQSWGRGRGGRVWRRLRKQIFERDNYLCQICETKDKLTPVTLHGKLHGVCDHIKAVSQGGTDEPSNLQTICQACDKIKTQQESQYKAI